MSKERRALLDRAARCRRVAAEISHAKAARRLKSLAQEYEVRADKLQDDKQARRDAIQAVDRAGEDDALV
jgi:hypothetical protein